MAPTTPGSNRALEDLDDQIDPSLRHKVLNHFDRVRRCGLFLSCLFHLFLSCLVPSFSSFFLGLFLSCLFPSPRSLRAFAA